jgi:hypothetical protein
MRKIFTLLAWSTIAAFGCSNSTNEQNIATEATHADDGGNAAGDAGDAQNGGALELTTFVRQLIENETADNNFPTTIDDKSFVDSEDANAFPPSFFQR